MNRELDSEGRASRPLGPARSGTGSRPSRHTRRALDGLNFFLADVQTGVGPFLAIYLAGYHWNEERVGLALMVGGIAGILAQTPAGAVVDSLRAKRALVGAAVAAVAAGALLTALLPSFWPVLAAQVLIGGASSVFIPAICAMSLGIVGRAGFDARQGRNQTFNSAGNVTAAVSMGLLGTFLSNRSVFFFVVVLAVPTILMLLRIRPEEIDHQEARGKSADEESVGEQTGQAESVGVLLKDRRLVIFLICAVMFHFANAAMLPLLGELLARGQGRSSMLFMSACVVTTQLVITGLASWSGRSAGTWGRKPLLLMWRRRPLPFSMSSCRRRAAHDWGALDGPARVVVTLAVRDCGRCDPASDRHAPALIPG